MSANLALLSNIAGVTALSVTALRGCFNGFTLLYKASSAGRDLSTIRVMIQIEQHRLDSWAVEVGLLDDDPKLYVSSNDAAHVYMILEQLELLLTDVKKLKSSYSLDVEVTTEQGDSSNSDTVDANPGIALKDRFGSRATKVLLEGQVFWRKFRWVSVDEDRVHKLLKQVRYFLRELWSYLDRAKQGKLENKVEMVSRIFLSNSTNQQYLSIASGDGDPMALGPSLNAAARMRQRGLILGLVEGPSTESIEISSLRVSKLSTTSVARTQRPSSGSLSSMRLSKKHLRLETLNRDILRELAYYEDRLVMLEWCLVEASAYEGAQARVNKISHLLHELTDPSCHSLQCLGYVEYPNMRRYGFVLGVPAPTSSALEVLNDPQVRKPTSFPIAIVALREMFNTVPCPSLNVRLQIAITVLESIMQLHTSGWLHKGLRSENIIVLKSSASIFEDLAGFVRPHMYLTGYAYSRSDDPAESTNPSPSQVDAELYRHPLSLGSSRVRYRMCFDLFSVGCVLHEIAVWSSLATTFLNAAASDLGVSSDSTLNEPQVHATHMQTTAKKKFISNIGATEAEDGAFAGGLMEGVKAAAGEAYAQIVMSCIRATAMEPNEMAHGEKDFVLQLENSSLVHLRRLAEVI